MCPLALTYACAAAPINNRGSVVSVWRIWMNEIYLHQQFEVFVEECAGVCIEAHVCVDLLLISSHPNTSASRRGGQEGKD